MNAMAYQSFQGAQAGDSLSDQKLARLQLPSNLTGASVLDLGCNEGFFSFEAKRRGAAYVLGIDHDEKVVKSAQARSSEYNLDVQFACGTMLQLPVDCKFDYVLLLSALHYIEEPAGVLAEIRRILKPNGV